MPNKEAKQRKRMRRLKTKQIKERKAKTFGLAGSA